VTEHASTATVVFTGDVSWDGEEQLSTRTQPPNRHERTIVLSL